MAEKPTIYINHQRGTIKGPERVIGRLFANPKAKSWFGPTESTIVIGDAERFRQTVDRLRELGYPLEETPAPDKTS